MTNVPKWLKKNWPFALYAVLIFAGIFFHECWRDEVQSLLEAKAATGPWNLITRVLRYEGHPALWHLFLKYLSVPGVNPVTMQLFNCALMIGTASIFWWRFPLDFFTRALFLFNYFFFFEYGLLSRAYSLGLFLFFFSIAFMDSRKPWLRRTAFAALVLLPQSSIYGALMATGLMAFRFLQLQKRNLKTAILEGAVFTVSFVLAVLQMIPPPDSGFALGWRFTFDLSGLLDIFQRIGEALAFTPTFRDFPLVWDVRNDLWVMRYVRIIFAAAILIALGRRLWARDRKIFWSFLISFGSLALFFYAKYLGGTRHAAHFLFVVAGFYWIANGVRAWKFTRLQLIFMRLIAASSALAGATLYVADFLYPFSDAKNASKVLSDYKGFSIAWPDFVGTTLSAYLDGREFYYFEGERTGSYIIWDLKRGEAKPVQPESFEAWLRDRAINSFVLATNNLGVAPFLAQRFDVEKLYHSEMCVAPDECYEVLRISLRGARSGSESLRKRIQRSVATPPE